MATRDPELSLPPSPPPPSTLPSSSPSSLFESAAADSSAPRTRGGVTAPLFDSELLRLGRQVPASVFLGTSSWSYPGWASIVYAGEHSEAQLARHGLVAYGQHPVMRTVGIDRSFYKPLMQNDYAHYAQQVPSSFRFMVKAPALITDAFARSERGAPAQDNPRFLDADAAIDLFVQPALRGLRHADGTSLAGPLVFQLSPLPPPMLRGDGGPALVKRLAAFFARLPQRVDGHAPIYAVELRNPELLTPRLVHTLRDAGVRLCLGFHSRMPAAARQSAALRAMDANPDEGDAWRLKGPLVVRWLLHAGLGYEQAKSRYLPFDRIVDADIATRGTLSHLIHVALRSNQPTFVVVGNKAEGSAPLTCIALARAIVGREP